jgi:hypothetical protein
MSHEEEEAGSYIAYESATAGSHHALNDKQQDEDLSTTNEVATMTNQLPTVG